VSYLEITSHKKEKEKEKEKRPNKNIGDFIVTPKNIVIFFF
jgi:hypothetical protein